MYVKDSFVNMKIKIFVIIFFANFIVVNLFGTNTSSYSGGMLIFQMGSVSTTNQHQDINDTSFGLGGILRLYFFNHFTTGIFGGTQRANYSSTNSHYSYITLGYGGPFIGLTHSTDRFRFTASAFLGMGSVKNLHIEEQNGSHITNAYIYKSSTRVASPLVSIDYFITQRLVLTTQFAYLMANYNEKRFQSPTLQVGILFNR